MSRVKQEFELDALDFHCPAFPARREQSDLGDCRRWSESVAAVAQGFATPGASDEPGGGRLDGQINGGRVAPSRPVQVGAGHRKPAQPGHQGDVALLEDSPRRTHPEDRVAARLPSPVDHAVQVGEVRVGDAGGAQGQCCPGARGQGFGRVDPQQSMFVAKTRRLVVEVQFGHFQSRIEAEEKRGEFLPPRRHQQFEIDAQFLARVDGDLAGQMLDQRRGFVGGRLVHRQPRVPQLHPLVTAKHDDADSRHGQRRGHGAEQQAPSPRAAVSALVQGGGPNQEGRREHQHGRPVQEDAEVGQPRRQVGSPVVVDVEE